jgi:hypothetical protein
VSGKTESRIYDHGIAFGLQLCANQLGKNRFVLSRHIIHF